MIAGKGLLQQLYNQGLLNHLDLHFARFLLEKAVIPSDELALAAALTCRVTAEGHICLDLKSVTEQVSIQGEDAFILKPPPPEQWRKTLQQSGVVGQEGEYQPLILDQADRLYLHRYWDYEQRLAKSLLTKAKLMADGINKQQLKTDITTLFPGKGLVDTNWQKVAAATAVLRQMCVISGGPGTGKTTTVTKLLVLLRLQSDGEALRIALAAPTGKAAVRMQEAIQRMKSTLPLSAEVLETIPDQAVTLHRLLGMRRGMASFKYHAGNPLPLDVLILDEASMIDVALMAKLMNALPARCRLIILGDKDQLASVEAGAVLGDICGVCRYRSRVFADDLASITAEPVPSDNTVQPGICDTLVVLQHSYRFAAYSDIGQLADAINLGDLERADRLSEGLQTGQSTISYAAHRYAALFLGIQAKLPVETLFEVFNRFRVLCALRQGLSGVVNLNQQITRQLRVMGLVKGRDEWFQGRPMMVTQNDYQQGLFNGDVGLLLPDPQRQGELGVVFQAQDRSLKWYAPSRLPQHETVFAMTVHKSQGSEFDEVLLHLPEQDSTLLTRELLYTAVTRAKGKFLLSGPRTIYLNAVSRRHTRSSGLADLLSGKRTFFHQERKIHNETGR